MRLDRGLVKIVFFIIRYENFDDFEGGVTWSGLSCKKFQCDVHCGRNLEQMKENGNGDQVRNFPVASSSDFWSRVTSKGTEGVSVLWRC